MNNPSEPPKIMRVEIEANDEPEPPKIMRVEGQRDED